MLQIPNIAGTIMKLLCLLLLLSGRTASSQWHGPRMKSVVNQQASFPWLRAPETSSLELVHEVLQPQATESSRRLDHDDAEGSRSSSDLAAFLSKYLVWNAAVLGASFWLTHQLGLLKSDLAQLFAMVFWFTFCVICPGPRSSYDKGYVAFFLGRTSQPEDYDSHKLILSTVTAMLIAACEVHFATLPRKLATLAIAALMLSVQVFLTKLRTAGVSWHAIVWYLANGLIISLLLMADFMDAFFEKRISDALIALEAKEDMPDSFPAITI